MVPVQVTQWFLPPDWTQIYTPGPKAELLPGLLNLMI